MGIYKPVILLFPTKHLLQMGNCTTLILHSHKILPAGFHNFMVTPLLSTKKYGQKLSFRKKRIALFF